MAGKVLIKQNYYNEYTTGVDGHLFLSNEITSVQFVLRRLCRILYLFKANASAMIHLIANKNLQIAQFSCTVYFL